MSEPPALRPYQADVVERVRARMAEGLRRVVVQAACGAGKTHVSSELCRRAHSKGKRVLFLAHRRRLIAQKSERLDLFGVPHGVLMAGVQRTPAFVQVASRDTLLARAVRGHRLELPPADLVITDEVHNAGADEYRALLERYPDACHVGLTATPARSDGVGLGGEGGFWTALECTVPTSRLVREGYLVPVRCYAPDVAVRRKGRAGGLHGDHVARWQELAAGRPTVLFAAKCAASRAACDRFCLAGIAAVHIDQRSTDEEREAASRGLEDGSISVVCNVGVWTEGVDVPCLSCCILLRMAGSVVLFLQAVGRIMRAHPGKKDAVLIDHAGAVLQHGFPDEDQEWSIDQGDTVDARNAKAAEEGKHRKAVGCECCGALFSGVPACPECGWKIPPPRKSKTQQSLSALLVEVERGSISSEGARQKFWEEKLYIAAAKGMMVGQAAQMYRRGMGHWPEEDGLTPLAQPWQRRSLVADVFPQFDRRRAAR